MMKPTPLGFQKGRLTWFASAGGPTKGFMSQELDNGEIAIKSQDTLYAVDPGNCWATKNACEQQIGTDPLAVARPMPPVTAAPVPMDFKNGQIAWFPVEQDGAPMPSFGYLTRQGRDFQYANAAKACPLEGQVRIPKEACFQTKKDCEAYLGLCRREGREPEAGVELPVKTPKKEQPAKPLAGQKVYFTQDIAADKRHPAFLPFCGMVQAIDGGQAAIWVQALVVDGEEIPYHGEFRGCPGIVQVPEKALLPDAGRLCRLPDMDGKSLSRKLEALAPDAKLVFDLMAAKAADPLLLSDSDLASLGPDAGLSME